MLLGSIVTLARRLHAYRHLSRQSEHVLADLGIDRAALWAALGARPVPNPRRHGPSGSKRSPGRPIWSAPTASMTARC